MDIPSEPDPHQWGRIIVLAVAIALNVWLRWDTPEFEIARRRVRYWWHRNVTDPEERERRIRLAAGETVMEAMRVVEGNGGS